MIIINVLLFVIGYYIGYIRGYKNALNYSLKEIDKLIKRCHYES